MIEESDDTGHTVEQSLRAVSFPPKSKIRREDRPKNKTPGRWDSQIKDTEVFVGNFKKSPKDVPKSCFVDVA